MEPIKLNLEQKEKLRKILEQQSEQVPQETKVEPVIKPQPKKRKKRHKPQPTQPEPEEEGGSPFDAALLEQVKKALEASKVGAVQEPIEEDIIDPEEKEIMEELPIPEEPQPETNGEPDAALMAVLNGQWLNTILNFGLFTVLGVVLWIQIFKEYFLQLIVVSAWLVLSVIWYAVVSRKFSPERLRK